MQSRNKGFTLIELIVVISIISVLAGAAVVGVMSALSKSKKDTCQRLITAVQTAVEQFQQQWGGEYPRVDLSLYSDNLEEAGVNGGIETCLLAIRTTKGGPYFPVESFQNSLANLDEDDAPNAYDYFAVQGETALFELIDPWGNPLVYIPEGSYTESFEYQTSDGEYVDVQAQTLAKTGTYPQGYMIWSFGPNGVNENGKGDDITSWQKSDADYESDWNN